MKAENGKSRPVNGPPIDGFVPSVVVKPCSVLDLSSTLRAANEHRHAVILHGAGTALSIGNPPTALHTSIDMSGLTGVVSHDVENFTITVEAGMSLATLQDLLTPQHQFLALNPPSAQTATVGGIVAADRSGPWRLTYGTCRDLVLGMKIVLADGRVVSFGGKTMKNVAGYDVHKLFIGSYGTLGAIAELTFRLHSLPATRRTVLIPAVDQAAAFVAAREVLSLQPTALWMLNPEAAELCKEWLPEQSGWIVAIDLMGDAAWIDQMLAKRATGSGAGDLDSDASRRFWDTATSIIAPDRTDGVLCKASLPSAAVETWISRIIGTPHSSLVACPGTGRVWITLPGTGAQAAVSSTRSAADSLDGHVVVESAPAGIQRDLDVWGMTASPAHLTLLRQVKNLFDPQGILSPERFAGGL